VGVLANFNSAVDPINEVVEVLRASCSFHRSEAILQESTEVVEKFSRWLFTECFTGWKLPSEKVGRRFEVQATPETRDLKRSGPNDT
jgi:hypothetical protein